MEWIELGELIKFQKKSKLKARDGKEKGNYEMYSSSMIVDKYVDKYQFSEEALIVGTGGSANIHYSSGKFATTADCYVLYKNRNNVLLRYIYKYLHGNIYILEEGFRGAGLKHINQKYLKKIKIPVPPLAIQEQIVEVLDRAQELIDKRRAQIQAMDSLIESIFYSMFGDPVRNEKGWEVKKLGELGRFISGGTPSRKVPEYFEGSIPWITTVALGKFKIGKEDSIELITEEAIYNSATKLIPKESIMIGTRVGIGKISINSVEMCTNQDIVSMTDIKESINLRYIFNTLSLFQVNLQSKSRGATIKGINMKVLKSITIPIPPLDLQNEFAQKVELIEREKERLEESLELMEENYRSIMDRAFKGQLFN